MSKGGNTRVKRPPTVFVSYSYDSAEHVRWVAEFATKLRSEANIDAILDQWDLDHGEDIVKFMERNVQSADRVLMICTTLYVHKANEGRGGAGYETMVVTAELVRDLGTKKFIPVIPPENVLALLPTCVSTRKYVDLRNPDHFEASFLELITSLHSLKDKPALGIDPRFASLRKRAGSILRLELNLDDTFAGTPVEFSRLTRNLVFSLKQGRPKTLRVVYPELKEFEVYVATHLKDAHSSKNNAVEVVDFVSEKQKRGEFIRAAINLLFSPRVNKHWCALLVSESDWQNAFSSVLNWFSNGGRIAQPQGLTKIDIWRSEEPKLSAPIFVTDEELRAILQARGLSDARHLAFGPGWVAADELPAAILVNKALPRILVSLARERDEIPDEQLESALCIFSWHVGLG